MQKIFSKVPQIVCSVPFTLLGVLSTVNFIGECDKLRVIALVWFFKKNWYFNVALIRDICNDEYQHPLQFYSTDTPQAHHSLHSTCLHNGILSPSTLVA